MEVWNEPAVLFEKSTMFTKSRFCKIYKVTSENPSGYLPHSHDYMQIWYITRTRGPVAVLRGSMFPKLRACASV